MAQSNLKRILRETRNASKQMNDTYGVPIRFSLPIMTNPKTMDDHFSEAKELGRYGRINTPSGAQFAQGYEKVDIRYLALSLLDDYEKGHLDALLRQDINIAANIGETTYYAEGNWVDFFHRLEEAAHASERITGIQIKMSDYFFFQAKEGHTPVLSWKDYGVLKDVAGHLFPLESNSD